ncbi:NUT family member 1 isoform X1 [Sarcophilus harrisii]|uniref:NUT midline carcinoma family member 1 n=1 Tax=Sarcophilus harrisii TaxID=9305 RepID=G3VMN0_SARHA|nr:NUT family member 1 isoform X1 [Sarcophilus harrisii]XP_031807874.1 NUT family member 1 isoform X1 [Sarcophilus harrisii]
MTPKSGPVPPCTSLPLPPPPPGPSDKPPWEPSPQAPISSPFPPGSPLVLSAFPSTLLVTGDGGAGPSGGGAGKVIVKVKTEGGPAEAPRTQTFILTQTALNWIAPGPPRGGPEGPTPRFLAATNVKTILLAKAVGVAQAGEGEGPPTHPPLAPPPTAQLAPIVPPEKAWRGPDGTPGEGGPPPPRPKPSLGDLSCTSKGVYENFRRWQRYKALARRHLPRSPDAEALSCFLIPVLRSLARLKPAMTLEDGLPRAVQEWERSSNFDRMIFYEMAEKFMEFEAEEEMQIQKVQLMSGSQCLPPPAPPKLDPPGPSVPEICQQQVYIPKKAASKSRPPRRRQRRPPRPSAPEAPKEIPPEAVKQYADIMAGLVGVPHAAIGEPEGKHDDEEEEEEEDEEEAYPDPGLLSYIEELCAQDVFVSKVEAVIHPRFLAEVLSPEQQRDPLALSEELEQEEGLTPTQLVQKRLLALEEEEEEEPPSCSGAQSDSSPSPSDEEEDGGGRLRPSPGARMAGGIVRLGKTVSPEKRARGEGHGQDRAAEGPRGVGREGNALSSPSSWDLRLDISTPRVTRGLLGVEGRGSGKGTALVSLYQEGNSGGPGDQGDYLVTEGILESSPHSWQKGPHLEGATHLEAGPPEPVDFTTSSQDQGMGQQVTGLRKGCQVTGLGMLPQGKEPSSASQEETVVGTSWRDDRGAPMIKGVSQSPSSRAAGDRERTPFSSAPWVSSKGDFTNLEVFPEQTEGIREISQYVEYITEFQGDCHVLIPQSHISSLGHRGILEDTEESFASSEDKNDTSSLENGNYYNLSELLGASSPILGIEGHIFGNGTDFSDLYPEGNSSVEGKNGASNLESAKNTLSPRCQERDLLLGSGEGSSFPGMGYDVSISGSKANSGSPVWETTENGNLLAIRDDHDLQLIIGVNSSSPKGACYECQRVSREELSLLKCKDTSPSPGTKGDSHTPESQEPASSNQCLGDTPPTPETSDPVALGETSSGKEAPRPTDRDGKEQEDDDDDDDELSNFAFLLASKLSLTSEGLPLSPLPAPTEVTDQASPSQSPEALPIPKSGKRTLSGELSPAEKRPCRGGEVAVSGELPLNLGEEPTVKPRKRRREGHVPGRRKKRRRSL